MARARGIRREGTLAVFPREREKTTGKKTGGRVEEMVVAVSVGCVGGEREKKGKSSETERRKGAKPEVNSRKKEKKQFEKKEPRGRKTRENSMSGVGRLELDPREAARRRPESVTG